MTLTGWAAKCLEQISAVWARLELARQFLVASAVAIILAMSVVGSWLASRIEQSVSQTAAVDAALYVESFVGERVQSLAIDAPPDSQVQSELERLVLRTPKGRQVVSFKVWGPGGRIVYASRPEHAGKVYTPTDNLRRAWTGSVEYELDKLHDAEDAVERALAIPILEIYVPVRRRFGGEVVAVVEFYEDATMIVQDIARAQREAWLLLALIGAMVVTALYGMARRASHTIGQQRAALNTRIVELSDLLAQNTALRERVETASVRAAKLNEQYLRRLGADLHDGPAQLISLALMRLDDVPTQSAHTSTSPHNDKQLVRDTLVDALDDIRSLSAGLSLPELDTHSLGEVVADAVRAHEHRTETRVALRTTGMDALAASRDVKATVYRLIQEGLNNAHRHARGASVSVLAERSGSEAIGIVVADDGPGFDMAASGKSDRIGLSGLRERLDLVGGRLEIKTAVGAGTRLEAWIPLKSDSERGVQ